ncbi:MAG: 5'-methylthioadenosine/adenosylhomocysteine nucleosidase [Synergistaceae bacterium]|nr:5'-methylthioadenosine/adenosylhomocysteine nucleosidase [Synergistaceae bacterium]
MRRLFLIALILAALIVPAEAQSQGKAGIIGAMDVEVNLLKEAASITRKTSIADMEFCEGRLGNSEVIIVKCGMGKVNAGICAQILITHFGVSEIISTGIAGALNPSLNIGDVVIARDCVQHDFDVSPVNFAKGEIPYTGKFAFESDEKLRREALLATKKAAPAIQVIEGRVCTGDQFIASKAQKDAITGKFGGDCCDMESGAIAQVCYLNKIPFVIIRAISDKADSQETIDFHEFEAEAARLSAQIVKTIITEGRN